MRSPLYSSGAPKQIQSLLIHLQELPSLPICKKTRTLCYRITATKLPAVRNTARSYPSCSTVDEVAGWCQWWMRSKSQSNCTGSFAHQQGNIRHPLFSYSESLLLHHQFFYARNDGGIPNARLPLGSCNHLLHCNLDRQSAPTATPNPGIINFRNDGYTKLRVTIIKHTH